MIRFRLPILLFALLSLSTSEPQPDASLSLSQPFSAASQNFNTYGSALLHSDTIDLTPNSRAHMLGAIWIKDPNPHQYWEAEFSFRISGAERGGNGLAFWYAAKRGMGGEVFGGIDQWDGFGLFFDPNTGGKSTVRGHLNAGDVRYDALADVLGNAFGSCPFVFRNIAVPIAVKITNADTLKVTLDGHLCFGTNQVLLPPGNYFGISASSGDTPDHHQIFGFKVTPLEVIESSRPAQIEIPATNDQNSEELKTSLLELSKQVQDWQEQTNVALRQLESSMATISKSLGTVSTTLNQIQNDIRKSSGSSNSIEGALRSLASELGQLEKTLKEHMNDHVGVLSKSLVGRGGFWKGIWMVIGVQAIGWVIYEFYRNKKDIGKKIV